MKDKTNEIIWVVVIVVLLLVVVLVSGVFYFGVALGGLSSTGHVVSAGESDNSDSNEGFVDKGDFRYKVNDLVTPLIWESSF